MRTTATEARAAGWAKPRDAESKVFYQKMKADYLRYKAEFKSGTEKSEISTEADGAYKAATEAAALLMVGFVVVLGVLWLRRRLKGRRPRNHTLSSSACGSSTLPWAELNEMELTEADQQPDTSSPICLSDKMLGHGAFSRVYAGTWAGVKVAVKVLHRHHSGMAREIKLLERLRHPCICALYDVAVVQVCRINQRCTRPLECMRM